MGKGSQRVPALFRCKARGFQATVIEMIHCSQGGAAFFLIKNLGDCTAFVSEHGLVFF